MPSAGLVSRLSRARLTGQTHGGVLVIATLALAAVACGGSDPELGTPSGDQGPPDVAQSGDSAAVQLFLVALEDGGRHGPEIGCGDSLVPISLFVDGRPSAAGAALEALVSLERHVAQDANGELYNALYRSSLRVDRIEVAGDTARAYLTGQLQLGGMCDTPRVKAQLERTLESAIGAAHVTVYLDGEPLDEALSAAG